MIRTVIARAGAALDRRQGWVLAALIIGLGVSLVARARAKPFWHDEVFTILASRLPVRTLWTASRDGLDLAPPLNTLLTRVVHATIGAGSVATRLPPMFGFMSASVILFVIARRRTNIWIALAAAVVPYFSGAFQYAYEARGYCVTLGCFAAALFGWSEAAAGRDRGRNLLLMAAALAAGVWTHYYAILSFLPIASGEFVRQLHHRRFEALPWTALAGAAASTLPLLPLLLASRAQAPTFWTRLEPFGLGITYDAVFGHLLSKPFAIGAGVILAIALAGSIRSRPERRPSSRRLEAHEVTAGLVTLAIPAAAMLVSELAGGVFVPRYVLPSVLGVALAAPLAVWRFGSDDGVADVVLCVALLVPFALDVGRSLQPKLTDAANPLDDRPILRARLADPDPIVVAGGLPYLQLWYYTTDSQKPRALYVADPATELRQTHADTIDRGYLALSRWAPVPVIEYDPFVRQHRQFQVYVCGSDWLTPRLRGDGAAFTRLRYELGCWLYAVRLPDR